jgi:hypothetical protein
MMSENRDQLIIIALVFWCGLTLLDKLHARLTYAVSSADLDYSKNSKKKQTARSPLQSLSPKKVARLAAIQRAKLAMESDKQKVTTVKRKKEREEGAK